MHLHQQITQSVVQILEDGDGMLEGCRDTRPVQAHLDVQGYMLTLDLAHINCPFKRSRQLEQVRSTKPCIKLNIWYYIIGLTTSFYNS